MMSGLSSSPAEQQRFLSYVITQLVDRASGRHSMECRRNYPHDVYFIGNVRSQDAIASDHSASAPHMPDLQNKLSPVAFGADFKLQPEEEVRIDVSLRWACYYRVFPTFDAQLAHQRHASTPIASTNLLRGDDNRAVAAGDEDGDEEQAAGSHDETSEEDERTFESGQSTAAPERAPRRQDSLLVVFRKIDCTCEGTVLVRTTSANEWLADISDLEASITREIERARAVVIHDPEAIRTGGDPYSEIRVPDDAITSGASYDAFRLTLRDPVIPSWQWQVRCECRSEENSSELIVSIIFANQSARQLSNEGKAHPHIEPFLFDAGASFVFRRGKIVPFEINLAPTGFRYDRHMWGRGFNCAVETRDSRAFVTTHVPLYLQQRYQTRATPPADFASLAQDPVPVLEQILASMETYKGNWQTTRTEFARDIPNWAAIYDQEFTKDQRLFDEEVDTFRRGLDLIRNDADVQLAFRLTNETFRRGSKTQWRLFQIVFLVSQIVGLAALANKPGADVDELKRADIIYFPTGGGKTEAYLAVLVFHCFLDRLRGKTAGVTAWIRFPLRLLTIQQTQRVADVICVADLVRGEQRDSRLNGPRIAGFGVGYFVGKSSTPNELADPTDDQYARSDDMATWAIANDSQSRQIWRRLISCPSCRTQTVTVDFDPVRVRLLHRCTNPTCSFPEGRIPVYVVDNEIYRYLPAVLVGTIDKLASLGNQRKVAQIFGSVDGYCKIHGFYKGQCCQRRCDNKQLVARKPSGLTGPTLFLQDELHLLKEGLGTFDSHYETFAQELLRTLNPESHLKIIASSATIEDFERQVHHLYDADPKLARMFPGPGPKLQESFYAETLEYPQRIYVGLIPHNKTIFNSMLELLELYHTIVQELWALPPGSPNPYGGALAPSSHDWFDMLDLYVTSLTYFLSGRDLNSLRTDLDDHVTPNLQAANHAPLELFQLTGSTSTDEVAQTLEHLQTPKVHQERATAVLATNMVSHGVDIDRLNAMFFFGMPRQNAEYIQASSRVGRTNMGLVFVCHSPARERDQSHYASFAKYHAYLGQLVEPVAINRWAKFSVNRTLPGLFMGILLQLMSNQQGSDRPNRYYLIKQVRQLITAGVVRAEDFIPFLDHAYRVDGGNSVGQQVFRDEIDLRVRQFIDQIVNAGADKTWVSDALIPHPMTSLRDVDDPIPIYLDRDGAQWARRTSK